MTTKPLKIACSLLLFTISPIMAQSPFTTIRYILPLEIKLGDYYLQSTTAPPQVKAPHTRLGDGDGLYLRLLSLSSSDAAMPWQSPRSKTSDSLLVQSSLLNLTYLNQESFFSFDLRQDTRRIPGSPDDLKLGTALSYGHSVTPLFALMFGVKTTGDIDPLRASSLVVDYGKVFLTPGLQLRSRSVIVETFLEMPVYTYDLKSRQSEFILPHDVKANIGIRYRP